ncbi:hypothetical protein TPAR_00468 [Tolypocladium paradoxum]|uniref:Uncharacterized protein n=1 Tax=Tolypocladium paradoxum TaxID=94208 RepID=A0A2S4LAB5_9HYPO|nr:hypothetical protein TPAR_00468 [Tolypocladium paradoxum]
MSDTEPEAVGPERATPCFGCIHKMYTTNGTIPARAVDACRAMVAYLNKFPDRILDNDEEWHAVARAALKARGSLAQAQHNHKARARTRTAATPIVTGASGQAEEQVELLNQVVDLLSSIKKSLESAAKDAHDIAQYTRRCSERCNRSLSLTRCCFVMLWTPTPVRIRLRPANSLLVLSSRMVGTCVLNSNWLRLLKMPAMDSFIQDRASVVSIAPHLL